MSKTAGTLLLQFATFMAAALLTPAQAQDGAIEFVAQASPSSGLQEPVRGFPLYLLSKSFQAISAESDAAFPPPDIDAFVAGLDVSKEMKVWMKKNRCVVLSGVDFVQKLQPDDVMNVPEFYKAYTDRESEDQSANFPKPKYKPTDKSKNPAKYQAQLDEYRLVVRQYLVAFPNSTEGIDLNLEDVNPGWKWNDLINKWDRDHRARVRSLAQSKYVVAHAETNLEGQGFLQAVPPGEYWLSSLDVSASIGDARPRWDVPITVRPGQTQYVALSEANSVQSPRASQ